MNTYSVGTKSKTFWLLSLESKSKKNILYSYHWSQTDNPVRYFFSSNIFLNWKGQTENKISYIWHNDAIMSNDMSMAFFLCRL